MKSTLPLIACGVLLAATSSIANTLWSDNYDGRSALTYLYRETSGDDYNAVIASGHTAAPSAGALVLMDSTSSATSIRIPTSRMAPIDDKMTFVVSFDIRVRSLLSSAGNSVPRVSLCDGNTELVTIGFGYGNFDADASAQDLAFYAVKSAGSVAANPIGLSGGTWAPGFDFGNYSTTATENDTAGYYRVTLTVRQGSADVAGTIKDVAGINPPVNFSVNMTTALNWQNGADDGVRIVTGLGGTQTFDVDNLTVSAVSHELLASYFDIQTGSGAGTEVMGKVNLMRNMDAHVIPVPAGYVFSITSDPSDIFELVNQRDSESRLFGMLRVKPGKTVAATVTDYPLTVKLSDGAATLGTVPVVVRAVPQTLHAGFLTFATNLCQSWDRLYGRSNPNDATVAGWITDLETNGGRFSGYDFYTRSIASYVNTVSVAPNLSTQWQGVAIKIGGLANAYRKSAKYGPAGIPEERLRLKNALYLAINTFLDRIPMDPSEVIINGQPIGMEIGDTVFCLNEKGIASYTDVSHQWIWTDPMTGPAVWLMPDLMAEMKNGDAAATQVHQKLLDFFQLSFGMLRASYRNPNSGAEWGPLTDPNHTGGAHSDANYGLRVRGWLTLPAIWADYNRPITYAPYWYKDYYSRYPGALFKQGWTPKGVLEDIVYWTRNPHRDSYRWGQPGFHPDGFVSHHCFAGTSDSAMWGYGYGWLTAPFDGYDMLKNSGFDLGSEGFNFIADRLLHAYDKLVYKGDFDMTTVGISYHENTRNNLVKGFPSAIDRLINAKQSTTQITKQTELVNWRNAIANGTQEATGNFPFWVGHSMVQRQGGQNASSQSHYFSVKMANNVAASDDGTHSYHIGSGVLQTKVSGTEYDFDVRNRWDWHALPGLTEEWRTDAMIWENVQQTTGNRYAGMASDGTIGFAAMRYRPKSTVTYAAAQADKGFFFSGDKAIALGSDVARRAAGQGLPIITTLDQTRWVGAVTYSIGGAPSVSIAQGVSTDVAVPLTGPSWIHQGSIGYLVFPHGAQQLYIRGGASVIDAAPATTSSASVIHFALGHGTDPVAAGLTKYHYMVIPNATAGQMPGHLAAAMAQIEVISNGDNVQGIYDHENEVIQLAFHAAGTAVAASGYRVAVDRPALVQLRRNGLNWELCATDPIHELNATAINIATNVPIKAGSYSHTLPGVVQRPGETVTVSQVSGGVTVNVPLPDPTDDAALNYQAVLYASVPIHVTVPIDDRINAEDDSVNTAEDAPVAIPVLTNDAGVGGTLDVQSVTAPSHGAVSVGGGVITYTPDAHWSGVDTFSYVAALDGGVIATAAVTVTVNPVNDAPVFAVDPVQRPGATQGGLYSGTLVGAATDVDASNPLIYSKVSGPAWLVVSADGQLSGRPASANVGLNSFIVRATDPEGLSDTAVLQIHVVSGLPAGWTAQDIGTSQVPGFSSESGGTFTITGAGNGVVNLAEQIHFTWQTMSGDGEVRARIASMSGATPNPVAGVMIRETLAVNAKSYFCGRSGAGTIHTKVRVTPGGSVFTAQNGTQSPPVWVRIVRSGSTVTAYKSTDGLAWTTVSTYTLSMAAEISVGLVVSSGDAAAAASATFDNLTVIP